MEEFSIHFPLLDPLDARIFPPEKFLLIEIRFQLSLEFLCNESNRYYFINYYVKGHLVSY